MKKILLATSALVAMSGVAVAGDIPAAPVAPMVSGFTVTATGSATIYGYYNDQAVVAPAVKYGVGGDFEGAIKAEKTLDNGDVVSVELVVDNGDQIEALVGYNSAFGEFKAGVIGGEDEHDIEVPDVSIPNIGDEIEDGDKGLTFAGAFIGDSTVALSNYTAFNPALTALVAADYSVTYASPEFGGFKLGLGVDGAGNIDTAVAGSFAAGDVTVAVGARYIATNPAYDKGVATAGATVAIAGFTIGAGVSADLNASANNTANVQLGYATGPFTVAAKYEALLNAADKGTITAGARYTENGLDVIVDGTYSLINTGLTPDAWTAAAGGTYAFGDITVGATVGASDNSAAGTTAVILASGGVDYNLNSNILIGAGVGYDGNDFGAAAGLKVSF